MPPSPFTSCTPQATVALLTCLPQQFMDRMSISFYMRL